MRIHLHIGAHKTATTYVQTRLMQERDLLADHGVAVAAHADVRRQVSDRLDAAQALGGVGTGVASVFAGRGLRRLIVQAGDAHTLIVSDENIAGPIASAGSPGGLYPHVGARVSALLKRLEGHETTIFLSLRAYPGFFDSVYAYQAGQRRAAPLERFVKRAAALPRGWPEVVGDVVRAAGPDRVVIWTHEVFARDPLAIADLLTGTPGLPVFSASHKPRLPSLTAKGLAVMERVADLLSDGEHARLSRVVARFSFDAPDGRVVALPPDVAGRLAARYEADLRTIEAMGCRIVQAAH